MIAVLQRVSRASVAVDCTTAGAIDRGLLVLLGVKKGDGEAEADLLARKTGGLRIFADEAGKMNRSCAEAGGAMLVVSQFTLCGDCRKGRRPSFEPAAPPDVAVPLYERFCERLREQGYRVETGVFGAMMDVELVNDGPVTFVLDTEHL
jgi:D-tyrosyl-tRNA(Tyr) deacylase